MNHRDAEPYARWEERRLEPPAEHPIECPTCYGSGVVASSPHSVGLSECVACDGSGQIEADPCDDGDEYEID